MPTSVAIAVAGSAIGSAIGTAIGSTILGTIAGAMISHTLRSAFSDKPSAPESTYNQAPSTTEHEASSRLVTVRQSVAPWQIIYGQTRVGGIMSYVHDSGDGWFHLVITYAGHRVEEIGDIYFDDELVPLDGSGNATGKFAGYATIQKSLGNEAANVQPFPDLVTNSGGEWGSTTHFQTGRAKIYAKLQYNPDLYLNGIPNITAVIKGKRVYDPRSALTAWSANAALCINDYMCDSQVGLGLTYATEVNETQLIAAANICDEAVSLAAGGTESRYTLNGAFQANVSPRTALARLLTSMSGTIRFLGGVWGIYPAVYVTPTVTLTVDDLRGPLSIRPKLSRRDLANAVKGVYSNPSNNWQPSDFPAVQSSTYYAEDNNEWIWRELDLPFTNSAATAQRIAKIQLLQTRQQGTVQFPGKLSCYQLQPGDTVMVTLSRYGYSAKVFEVQTVALQVQPDGTVGCDLVLRETDSSVYSWSTSEEQAVDPAPDSTLPDPFTTLTVTLGTPTSGTNELFVAGDGTVFSRIKLPISSPNVYLDHFQAQFALSSGSPQDWQDAPRINREDTFAYFYPVRDGVSYDLRVRAVSALGNAGAWSYYRGYTVVGKTEPPSAPSTFSVAQQGAVMLFVVGPVTDADLDAIEIRYGETTNGWDDASVVGNILRGQEMTTASIPPGTWKFFARSRDTSGNYSTTTLSTTAEVTATGSITIFSRDYAAQGWVGEMNQLVKHWTQALTLDSTSLASDLGWEVFDQFVPNPVASGYFIPSEIDKGVDAYARVFSDAVTLLGPGETTGNASSRFNLDYKLSTGAYDGYEEWSIGTANFRYAKGKLILDSSIGNVVCSEFTITIDGQERTERANSVSVDAAGTAITYGTPFHLTPNLQVTNVGTPVRLTGHQSNSTTGATLRTFDTAGAGAAGTVDWNATGV